MAAVRNLLFCIFILNYSCVYNDIVRRLHVIIEPPTIEKEDTNDAFRRCTVARALISRGIPKTTVRSLKMKLFKCFIAVAFAGDPMTRDIDLIGDELKCQPDKERDSFVAGAFPEGFKVRVLKYEFLKCPMLFNPFESGHLRQPRIRSKALGTRTARAKTFGIHFRKLQGMLKTEILETTHASRMTIWSVMWRKWKSSVSRSTDSRFRGRDSVRLANAKTPMIKNDAELSIITIS